MLDVKYYVDEEKKVVVAKIENCAFDVVDDMVKKGYPGDACLIISDTFVGKAKCSDEDTFDVEKGKKIAFEKALIKYMRAKERVINKVTDCQLAFLKDFMTDTAELKERYSRSIAKRQQNIAAIVTD